jgi:DNA-binding NarL/FixJ family response regulator
MGEAMQIFAATGDVALVQSLKRTLSLVMPVRNEFHRCSTAVASLRLASFYGPDIAFVDARMANHGLLIAELRIEHPTAVVILVTAANDKDSLHQALACGARDYIARDAIDVEAIDRCVWGAVAAWSERLSTAHVASVGRTDTVLAWN